MKRTAFGIVMLVALSAAGCLKKETTSTIYLHPDGSLDWVVLEQHVRSDESDAAKRAAEEFTYVDSVAQDRHPVADSFRALGGRAVRTRLLREERPYAAMIDAKFDSLTSIFENALSGCAVPRDIRQTVEGDVTTWRLWVDIGADGANLQGEGCGDGVGSLPDLDTLTVILDSGVFTGAVGFTTDGDTARFDEQSAGDEILKKNNGQLVLSLSWKHTR